MTKRMLIDATHAEETRVVVLDGNRLEDFDVETSTKRQLKGNIYLAKVVRVEPSLQAAFVEYGGNRHGFLAFSEIHPDYYQIPVADRQRLIEMQAEEARREEEEADLEVALSSGANHQEPDSQTPEPALSDHREETAAVPLAVKEPGAEAWAKPSLPLLIAIDTIVAPQSLATQEPVVTQDEAVASSDAAPPHEPWSTPELPPLLARDTADQAQVETSSDIEDPEDDEDAESFSANDDHIAELPPPETMGGDQDNGDEQRERRLPPRFMRNYKIQEVIRRRQILLVQVVKEERGTKGAALTTYLSLAGRFGVLMPNSPRGGGISRKITSATDRRRLKEVMAELDIPRGMGMIVRTAGANRPKPEIKRDCEYLLRLWDDIREHTMKSVAPALIYEEASLIKRAIRDVYSRDIDEILVDGEDGWRAAHDFMRMLMPSHAKKVQLWRDGGQPLFARQQVEAQLDGMLLPTVQLRSGGYLVINQAEALVAIDVNSGRSTRERNIEETALRTNLEAADEIARQLRLRDLAGLIVVDFIDMEFEAAQRDGRAPDEGSAEERPRPYSGRPYQPFRPAGNEPPAAAPVVGGNQLHPLPALRRHRPRPQHRKRRDPRPARHRGRRKQAPRRGDRGACVHPRCSLHSKPQARAAARDRTALRDAGGHRRGRYADRAAVPGRPGAAPRC